MTISLDDRSPSGISLWRQSLFLKEILSCRSCQSCTGSDIVELWPKGRVTALLLSRGGGRPRVGWVSRKTSSQTKRQEQPFLFILESVNISDKPFQGEDRLSRTLLLPTLYCPTSTHPPHLPPPPRRARCLHT